MKTVLSILFIFVTGIVFAQVEKEQRQVFIPNNLQRYQLDYEIKNAAQIDTVLVFSLQLDQFDPLRHETNDVEIFDPVHQVTIILYSIQRCQQNKSKTIYSTQSR